MADQIRIRFRNFTGIDFTGAQRMQRPGANGGSTQDLLLRGAISGLAATGSNAGKLFDDTRGTVDRGAPMSITGSVPGATMPWARDYTITEGVTAGAGAVTAFSLGSGCYFWKKSPGFEIGLYGSVSVGLVTNIGASAGVQIGFLFGPAPSVLAGDSVTVSVTVDGPGFSVGGSLFLTAPPTGFVPPAGLTLGDWLNALNANTSYVPAIVGFGFTLSMGFSALPADISVMPGRTWTRGLITR